MSLLISNNTTTTTNISNNNNTNINTTNNIPEQQQQHQQTCFSFKKQPIPSRISCHSAISSFIEPENHNHLSSQLSSATTSPTSSTRKKLPSSNDDVTEQDLQMDYDEQIRAPRMSTLSKTNSIIRILEHEPLGDCDYMHRNSNDSSPSKKFSNASSRNTSATSNTSMDLPPPLLKHHHSNTEQQTHAKQYCPATYDLSQPLRRYSSPSINNSSRSPTSLHQQQQQLKYAEIAKRALENLQSNTTSLELLKKKDPRERICADGPIRQIDEPKTPNYVPLVLRPPNFQSSHYNPLSNTRKSSFSSSMNDNHDSRSSSPVRQLSATHHSNSSSLVSLTTSDSSPTSTGNGGFKFMELPKSHWIANNERTSCVNCQSKFSIINRKHHCRKCGEIFCFNCCYIRASLNFKLNFDLINGVVVKVCNNCGIDYNQYIRKNFVDGHGSSNAAQKLNNNTKDNSNDELFDKERKNSSLLVPVDWNWSSF